MNNINKIFIRCVKDNNLEAVTKLLDRGADIHTNNDCALQCSITSELLDMIELLLVYGANLHCGNKCILKNLCRRFNERLPEREANLCNEHVRAIENVCRRSDERLAQTILPYCDSDDYEYFPCELVCKNVISKKSSANI